LNIGSQIDIAPTILGLLGVDYKNNSFGMNLFNESREFAVLDATTKYGIISKEWLLIVLFIVANNYLPLCFNCL